MAWDDFLDNLQDHATDSFSNWTKLQIDGVLGSTGFIKVGEPPKSNLTAEQVAQGQRGVGENTVIKSRGNMEKLGGMIKDNMIIAIGVGAVILALLMRRR